MGGVLGIVSGVIGVGNALFGGGGGGGGSGSGGQVSTGYVPQNPGQADSAFQTAIASTLPATNTPQMVVPGMQAATQNLLSNPYTQPYLGAANAAGQIGSTMLPTQAFYDANNLFGLGSLGSSVAPFALAQGFDPQGDIYNALRGQNMDQTNAINAMNGVAGTPYGAGLATESNQKFNMDWIANELQRQTTGVQNYNALLGGAGTAFTGGLAMGNTGLNAMTQYGGLPYNTWNTIGQNQMGALSQYAQGVGGALGPSQMVGNMASSYLTGNQNATSLQQQGQGMNFQNAQQNQTNLGSSLAGLGQAFSNLNFGGGGGGGGFNNNPNPGGAQNII